MKEVDFDQTREVLFFIFFMMFQPFPSLLSWVLPCYIAPLGSMSLRTSVTSTWPWRVQDPSQPFKGHIIHAPNAKRGTPKDFKNSNPRNIGNNREKTLKHPTGIQKARDVRRNSSPSSPSSLQPVVPPNGKVSLVAETSGGFTPFWMSKVAKFQTPPPLFLVVHH